MSEQKPPYNSTEHKLSKETRLIIADDGTAQIIKKLPLGAKGKMLEFCLPLSEQEWDVLTVVAFNQDAHTPLCAECGQYLHSCTCQPEGRKRKKVVVLDALLKEYDAAYEEFKQWEEEETATIVCDQCGGKEPAMFEREDGYHCSSCYKLIATETLEQI